VVLGCTNSFMLAAAAFMHMAVACRQPISLCSVCVDSFIVVSSSFQLHALVTGLLLGESLDGLSMLPWVPTAPCARSSPQSEVHLKLATRTITFLFKGVRHSFLPNVWGAVDQWTSAGPPA
jgi:hypothetical protein